MRSATILGCRVDAVGRDEAVGRIVRAAKERSRPEMIVTLGTEMVVRAQHDADFRRIVGTSALSLCDTIGVELAARLSGTPLPERITGVDLIVPVCTALAEQGSSVYFLGGKGDTAALAAEAVRRRCPGLIVAGSRDGYFTSDEDLAVARAIAASGAAALFVGLGSPRQERFLAERLQDTGCGVGIGIGGSFDVLSGKIARAPAIVRRFNLEWLYRLVREPSRWKRQLALPTFVWLVVRERIAPSRRYT